MKDSRIRKNAGTALVIGGAGFIGSNLVDALIENEMGVKVLDNLSTGRLENLSHVAQQIELEKGDVRYLKKVQSLC